MNRLSPHRSSQRGFGLVEMMIAMVLGLLLLAAAVQVFLSTRASQRYNQALAEIQDSARYAMYTLTHDLRLTGYTGCAALASSSPSVAGGTPWGPVNVIADAAINAGITQDNLLANPLAAPGNQLPSSADNGSDALRLAYMRDYGVRVIDPTPHGGTPSNANIKVSGNPAGWEQDDVLLVTNCRQADLFAATSVSQAPGGKPWINIAHANSNNTNNRLSTIYAPGARVLEPYAAVYYVHEDGGLYRREYFARPAAAAVIDELVTGVSDMVVRYGVDNNGDGTPDAYRNQAQVTAANVWSNVATVRVGFVVGSQTRIGNDAGDDDLSVLGVTVDPPDDGRLRQVFTTTIALRNRVP